MQDLLEFLAREITGQSDIKVILEENQGFLNYKIVAPQDFMGLLVGKGGRTIKAIRNLLKVRATLEKKAVGVSIEETTS